jgi:AraC-like DNA-binding protein
MHCFQHIPPPCVAAGVLLLCSLVSSEEAVGADGSLKIEVPFTAQRISINGDLSEWDSAAAIEFESPHQRGERDNSATVKLLWDREKLYAAFIVRDTELRGSYVADDEEIWKDDAVEVFIDSKHDGDRGLNVPEEEFLRRGGMYDRWGDRKFLAPDDYHFIVNVRGSLATLRGVQLDQMDFSWNTDILYAVTLSGSINDGSDIDTQYMVELAIPWSSMGVRPRDGLVLGADFGVEDVDSDGRHRFDWCDVGSFNKPYLWGDIVLVGGENRPLPVAAVLLSITIIAAVTAAGFVAGLRRDRKSQSIAGASTRSSRGVEIAAQIQDCIERNYASPGLSASGAARELGISRRYLNMVLRRQGKPIFSTMLLGRRMSKATELLRNTDMSIAEIASATGFGSQSAFSTMFKTETGISPSDYRKNPSGGQ